MLVDRVRAGLRLPSARAARRRARAALLLVVPLAGCAFEVEPDGASGDEPVESYSAAIEGGYADRVERAVVGLAILNSSGRLARTCSGALVAPDLVLTAQHCIAEAPRLIRCDEAEFGPAEDAVRVHVTTSDQMWSSNATWSRGREILLPPGGRAVCGQDLALIALESPIADDEIRPLDVRLDRAAEEDEPYSAVGFGNTSGDVKDAGARRRRDGLAVECVGYRCGDGGQVAGNEWRGDAGACSGDSGGPALDGEGRVLGITSRGPDGCDDPIYGGLMDHRAWLAEAATRAAEQGSYPLPGWVDAVRGGAAAPVDYDPRWASCAAAPRAPGGERGAWCAAVGALALSLAAARRRSRIPARARSASPLFLARMRAQRQPRSAPCPKLPEPSR